MEATGEGFAAPWVAIAEGRRSQRGGRRMTVLELLRALLDLADDHGDIKVGVRGGDLTRLVTDAGFEALSEDSDDHLIILLADDNV